MFLENLVINLKNLSTLQTKMLKLYTNIAILSWINSKN